MELLEEENTNYLVEKASKNLQTELRQKETKILKMDEVIKSL